jgi:hypothetical protein
MGDEL